MTTTHDAGTGLDMHRDMTSMGNKWGWFVALDVVLIFLGIIA